MGGTAPSVGGGLPAHGGAAAPPGHPGPPLNRRRTSGVLDTANGVSYIWRTALATPGATMSAAAAHVPAPSRLPSGRPRFSLRRAIPMAALWAAAFTAAM